MSSPTCIVLKKITIINWWSPPLIIRTPDIFYDIYLRWEFDWCGDDIYFDPNLAIRVWNLYYSVFFPYKVRKFRCIINFRWCVFYKFFITLPNIDLRNLSLFEKLKIVSSLGERKLGNETFGIKYWFPLATQNMLWLTPIIE